MNPAKTEKLQGLYMVEPYQPGKIPVLMVHGLWSSPMTWMEMFNDLRSVAGDSRPLPVLVLPVSDGPAVLAQRRRSCAATWPRPARSSIPQRRQPALDQMVLVGHSMGGLVSRLQTIDSGDDFWNVVSDEPFQTGQGATETRQELADTFFFQPNPSMRRVITIGTPHRGSEFANSTTRWLGSKLIKLPQMLVSDRQQLYQDNPDVFRKPNLIDVDTSIDSLSPDSPILPVMLAAQRPPWVQYHNIVGVIPDKGLLGRVGGRRRRRGRRSPAPPGRRRVARSWSNADHLDRPPPSAQRARSAPHPAGAPGRDRRPPAEPLERLPDARPGAGNSPSARRMRRRRECAGARRRSDRAPRRGGRQVRTSYGTGAAATCYDERFASSSSVSLLGSEKSTFGGASAAGLDLEVLRFARRRRGWRTGGRGSWRTNWFSVCTVSL